MVPEITVNRISYSSNHGGSQEHISLITIMFCFVIPAKARDYVITGIGLSVCLSASLFVCLFVTTITK